MLERRTVASLLPILVVVAAAAYFVVGESLIDLQVYRAGGLAVLHGQDVYTARPPGISLPFTYPPFAAVVFAQTVVLPLMVLGLVWTLASLAALAFVLREAGRAVGRTFDGVVLAVLLAVAVVCEPVRQTLGFGQVNLFVCAMVVADARGQLPWLPRGVLVGLAAGLKLTPLIFVAYLFTAGRWRAALVAVGTFVATVLPGLLVTGSWTYWTELALDSSRVGGVGFVSNQSVAGVLARLNGTADGTELAWLVVGAGVGVVGMAAAAAASRRGAELLGVTTCGITALLVSPISWSHHYVWAVPAAVLLVDRAVRDRRSAWPAACWVGVFLVGPIWWVPHRHGLEYEWSLLQWGLGSSHVLLALGWVLVVAATEARRLRLSTTRTSCPPSSPGPGPVRDGRGRAPT